MRDAGEWCSVLGGTENRITVYLCIFLPGFAPFISFVAWLLFCVRSQSRLLIEAMFMPLSERQDTQMIP
jgi:hypothetical protein